MQIRGATHRRSIAKSLRDPFDHGLQLSFGLALPARPAVRSQQAHRDRRALPGAEVLGAEVVAGRFTQIAVHIRGFDGLRRARLIEIGKELLTWKLLTAANDARQARIGDADHMVLTALAAKMELGPPTVDIDVLCSQRCESIRMV